MAEDAYGQSKCLKFVANSIAKIPDSASLIFCIRAISPKLSNCLAATDVRVSDAAVGVLQKISGQCRTIQSDRVALSVIVLRDVLPAILGQLRPTLMRGPRAADIVQTLLDVLGTPEAVQGLREQATPVSGRLNRRLLRCVSALGMSHAGKHVDDPDENEALLGDASTAEGTKAAAPSTSTSSSLAVT